MVCTVRYRYLYDSHKSELLKFVNLWVMECFSSGMPERSKASLRYFYNHMGIRMFYVVKNFWNFFALWTMDYFIHVPSPWTLKGCAQYYNLDIIGPYLVRNNSYCCFMCGVCLFIFHQIHTGTYFNTALPYNHGGWWSLAIYYLLNTCGIFSLKITT